MCVWTEDGGGEIGEEKKEKEEETREVGGNFNLFTKASSVVWRMSCLVD